jgi:hypothetical protein
MTVRTQLVIYIGAVYATLNTAQLHAYLLLADHKYSILYSIVSIIAGHRQWKKSALAGSNSQQLTTEKRHPTTRNQQQQLTVTPTEYIFYCKRAILFLSSSKILTPHPPLRPASVYPPPLLRGVKYVLCGDSRQSTVSNQQQRPDNQQQQTSTNDDTTDNQNTNTPQPTVNKQEHKVQLNQVADRAAVNVDALLATNLKMATTLPFTNLNSITTRRQDHAMIKKKTKFSS